MGGHCFFFIARGCFGRGEGRGEIVEGVEEGKVVREGVSRADDHFRVEDHAEGGFQGEFLEEYEIGRR